MVCTPQEKTEIFCVNVDGVNVKDQLGVTTSFYNVTSLDEPIYSQELRVECLERSLMAISCFWNYYRQVSIH